MTRQRLPPLYKIRHLPSPSRTSWREEAWITDEFFPDGILADVTPKPGRRYIKATWPPRGRGRGEPMFSPRRIAAQLRGAEVIRLRRDQLTWEEIAARLGFADKSGAWRAARRAIDRMERERWLRAH